MGSLQAADEMADSPGGESRSDGAAEAEGEDDEEEGEGEEEGEEEEEEETYEEEEVEGPTDLQEAGAWNESGLADKTVIMKKPAAAKQDEPTAAAGKDDSPKPSEGTEKDEAEDTLYSNVSPCRGGKEEAYG
eukprot:9496714-Pyramimonas_sp.AAC.2